jgi:hypothetical protein
MDRRSTGVGRKWENPLVHIISILYFGQDGPKNIYFFTKYPTFTPTPNFLRNIPCPTIPATNHIGRPSAQTSSGQDVTSGRRPHVLRPASRPAPMLVSVAGPVPPHPPYARMGNQRGLTHNCAPVSATGGYGRPLYTNHRSLYVTPRSTFETSE